MCHGEDTLCRGGGGGGGTVSLVPLEKNQNLTRVTHTTLALAGMTTAGSSNHRA